MQLNKLRWINNDLNRQVFDASQRGHRLANKLGYQNLEEAEAALATQVAEDGQSQFEQLSQHPAEELASHVQELQSELLSHVNLGKKTLDALNEAVEEMSALREKNLALRAELESLSAKKEDAAASAANATEVEYLREELAALHKQYAELQEAKERSDHQHGEDFRRWKRFRDWILEEERKEKEEKAEEDEPAAKRRKVSSQDESDDKENFDTMSPDLLPDVERERRFGGIKRRLQEKRKKSRLGRDIPGRAGSPGERPCLSTTPRLLI